jgi:hypothetical protein
MLILCARNYYTRELIENRCRRFEALLAIGFDFKTELVSQLENMILDKNWHLIHRQFRRQWLDIVLPVSIFD